MHLLPGFDELLLGYADRTAVLAREHADRVVGTWRPKRGARATDLEATPFTAFADGVEAAARRRHARLPA